MKAQAIPLIYASTKLKQHSMQVHGQFYELYAIAAAVVGGCSLRGGEGTVAGVLLGAALLQVLRNAVNLWGIPTYLEYAVIGGVILIGATADEVVRQGVRWKGWAARA